MIQYFGNKVPTPKETQTNENEPNESQALMFSKSSSGSLITTPESWNHLMSVWESKSKPISHFISNQKLWDTEDRWNNKQTRSQRHASYEKLTQLEQNLFDCVDIEDVQMLKAYLASLERQGYSKNEVISVLNKLERRTGASLLHNAVFKQNFEIVKLLLEKGSDPNVKAANGSTPLHWACQFGSLEIVKLLVSNGSDLNATTNSWLTDSVFGKSSGQTPLHWACEKGHLDIIVYLLRKG